MTDQSDEKIKLHIGGQRYREGWKILDPIPGPIIDYVGNCSALSFLQNESCGEVYASHVFGTSGL
jgi:predicted SAM-dependent methyltransferase